MTDETQEDLVQLARQGADAFIAAAGGDLWPLVRDSFSRLLGRSPERLERARAELTGPDAASAGPGVHRGVAEKLEDVLGADPQSIAQLRSLLAVISGAGQPPNPGIQAHSRVSGPISGVVSTIGAVQGGEVAIGGKIGKVEKHSKFGVPLFVGLSGFAKAHTAGTAAGSIVALLAIGGVVWVSTGGASKPAAPSAAATTASTASPATASAGSPAMVAAVQQAWETFFNMQAPLPQRAASLENGTTTRQALVQLSADTTFTDVNGSATVSSVTFSNAHTAEVVYTFTNDNAVITSNEIGVALLIDGSWVVSDTAVCQFLEGVDVQSGAGVDSRTQSACAGVPAKD